jgi:hypothetical protein
MNIKIMSEYTKFLESIESANKEENVWDYIWVATLKIRWVIRPIL